ncbi:MAG TPA: N-6 DNA methylase [Trueperaceae bacterium]
MRPQTVPDPRNKELGAYYTEARVASALCRWAMRSSSGRLLDPAFGGGVFLNAAVQLAGRQGLWELTGVELEEAAHARCAAHGSDSRLINADFFTLGRGDLPRMDAVVGNPPFIRFQRFTGGVRTLALRRARETGIDLPPLAGSWVAFVAHATTFLANGGRLAMVVPAEVGHAPSARPLLDLLHRSFVSVTLVSFRRSLFPHLDQETVLLLADGYGRGEGHLTSLVLPGPEALERPLPRQGDLPLDARALIEGRSALAHSWLEGPTLDLYTRLAERNEIIRLGDLARVESGYVTGANSHFHLSPRKAEEWRLPNGALVAAVFRPRALAGWRFGLPEWQAASLAGHAGYLVQAAGFEGDGAVGAFIERLREAGVHTRYKARHRRPWYRIGRVAAPPLILPSMGSGSLPLVHNAAAVAVPNTFHAVTPVEGAEAEALAACWRTSLTDLSLELEGHGLGGGLLKLDPGEARNVLLPSPALLPAGGPGRIAAAGDADAMRECADELLLRGALGLDRQEVAALRRAAADLRARRLRK